MNACDSADAMKQYANVRDARRTTKMQLDECPGDEIYTAGEGQ